MKIFDIRNFSIRNIAVISRYNQFMPPYLCSKRKNVKDYIWNLYCVILLMTSQFWFR